MPDDRPTDGTEAADQARENAQLKACLAGVLEGDAAAAAQARALLTNGVPPMPTGGRPADGAISPKHLGRFAIFLFVLGLGAGGYFIGDGDVGMGLVLIFGMCVVPTLVLFVVPWAFPGLLTRYGNPAGGPWHGPVDRQNPQ